MPDKVQQLEERIRSLEFTLNTLARLDRFYFSKIIQIQDGTNMQLGLTTGTKFGTATTQKIGFLNATPVSQQSSITSPTADTSQLKTAVDAIITVLENFGFIAPN